MKKIHALAFGILLLSLGFWGCTRCKNCADIEITTADSKLNSEKTSMFELKKSKLLFHKIYVMQGSNTGLEMVFKKKLDEASTATFKIFLPSGKKFEVYADHLERIHNTNPDLPFTLTEKDFDSIFTSRINYPVKAYFYYEEETKQEDNTSKIKTMTFEHFSIAFKELEFLNGKCTIYAFVKGSLSEKYKAVLDIPYEVDGYIKITEAPFEVKKLED